MSTDLLGLVGGTDLEIKSHCMLNLCLDECATEYQCDNSEMMDDVSTRAPSPLLSRASSLDLDSDMGECAGLAQVDSAYDDDDDDLCLPAACCHDTEEGHVASTYNTLESMNLLSPLCLHLEPIREIADEDVDESDPFSFLSEHPYVMKVTASAAMPPSRKTKGKIASKPSAEPLKKRPLFSDELQFMDDEFEPVSIQITPFLLEDTFGKFMRSIIQPQPRDVRY
jgi:hypothetical protein